MTATTETKQKQTESQNVPEENVRGQTSTKAKLPTQQDLTILVCSGNLGNAEPSQEDMAAWIPPEGKCSLVQNLPKTKYAKEYFDLIVLGMQESTWSAMSMRKLPPTPMSSRVVTDETDAEDPGEIEDEEDAAMAEEKSSKDMSKLALLVDKTLGGQYQRIAEKQRGQMRLAILARSDVVPEISNLKVTAENTGVAHVLANKGGIVVSLTYKKNTRISFVSAHLAAHEGDNYYKARCDNLLEIFRGTKTHDRYDVTLSSHHVFLMGDLNFRTRFPKDQQQIQNSDSDKSSAVKQVLDLIRENKFEELYKYDELQEGLRKGDLLTGFETLPCHFHPTFKVLREAGFTYKEQRTPSYTDRILFKSSKKGLMKSLAYEPCPDFTSSDHKPIRGSFAITPNSLVNRDIMKQEPKCSYHLKFHSMSCTDLPSLDVIGKSDPYIMLTWDYINIESDHKQKGVMKWTSPLTKRWPKTSFLSRTADPVYQGEELNLFFNGPVGVDALVYVTVMDYDMNSKDDLIATLPLDLRALVSQIPNGQNKAQVRIDQPLIKFGKEMGGIQLSVAIERSDATRSIKDKSKKDSICAMLCRNFCC